MAGIMESKFEKREYICTGEVQSLSIISKTDGIRITSGDVKQMQITYWEKPEKYEYDLSESDGKVMLAFRKSGSFLSGIHCTLKDTSIEVVVPRDFMGAVDLNCVSGEITAAGIHVSRLTIACTSGTVKITDLVSGNEVRVINKTGDIKLCGISCTDIVASNKSGTVHLEDVMAHGLANVTLSSGSIKCINLAAEKDVTVSNKSGVINLESVSAEGSASASNTSGGVHFEALCAGGNITLKSTSGSIKGSIVGKEEDFSIHSVSCSGANNLKTASTNGSKQLNVKTTSGSIKVKFI